jgi:hypothetical protein
LLRWRGERAALLDQLFNAHTAVGGTGAGRRSATEELNRALLLRLAAQFQGFAKHLHTEVAVTFGDLAQPNDHALARVISTGLQTRRELDRLNAQEDSLASDFGRFGIDLWDDMTRRDARTPKRRTHLRWFNTARNALAHDDLAKLAPVLEAGYRIDLDWLRRWRQALDGLAGTIDDVMSAHLARQFGVARPW